MKRISLAALALGSLLTSAAMADTVVIAPEQETVIRYLHLVGTRDAEILAKLREKLERIDADLGSAVDDI